MRKELRRILKKMEWRMTSISELQRADVILKKLSVGMDEEENRKKIKRVRSILRRQKYLQRKKLYLRITTAGAVLILVLIILTVSFFAHAGKISDPAIDETEDTSETEYADSESIELVMSFTGDCILGTDEFFDWNTSLNAYHEAYGGAYFLDNVRDIFKKDDLTIINMEGTLTEESARLEKQFAFKGPMEFIDILSGSSIEAANIANNHSHDYGEKSFQDTVELLEKNNIAPFGYERVQVLDVKGIKVGFFGIYELDDHLTRIPQVKENISTLRRQNADVIVAVFHWGNELEEVPDSNQTTLAHLAIDEGADLVIGHHPHILQGVEQYKGKNIAYSLGNFCFGGNTHPAEMDTMIFQQKFVLNSEKKIIESEINMIPCMVSSEVDFNNYQPTPMEGEEAQRIIEKIQMRSDAIAFF